MITSGRSTIQGQRRGSEDGAATVELALVMPILFTLLLGIVDMGLALQQRQALTNASRAGARAAILMPDDWTTQSETAIESAGQQGCADFLVGTLGLVAADALTACSAATEDATPAPGETVTVTATLPYTSMVFRFIGLTPERTLVGTSIMMLE